MQIDEPTSAKLPAPLWRLAFRAGFLAAGSFAVISMLRWLYWMHSPSAWGAGLSAQWWHAHEMVFGFAMPVVAGFLLSAVATWTGTTGTRGLRLQLLFGLWLLARILLWFATEGLPPAALWLAWAAEMAFLALLAYELGSRVLAARQWRNVLFLPVLLALALFNTAAYLESDQPARSTALYYAAVWMMALLVAIVGGRVIPLFTGNRLGLKIAPLPGWLEYAALLCIAAVGLLSASSAVQTFDGAFRLLCLVGALLHGYRLAHWRGGRTSRVPLLWSMHLSYLCMPLSLLALAVAGDNPVTTNNVIHLLGLGCVGGMILAMMARVSLGHTGRALETPWYVAVAFALVLLAALLRSALPQLAPELTMWAWRLSAGLWIAAFAIFLYRYLPILSRARADGKPG